MEDKLCPSCSKSRPKARWDMLRQKMVIVHGPCTCPTTGPVERIMIRAYSSLRSNVYSLVVGERGLIRRLKLDQTRRGRSHDEDVMRAGRYERLSTDYVLGMNVGIYRRQKWEPLKEAIFALERARSAMRLAVSRGRLQQRPSASSGQPSRSRQLDVLHERLSNLFYDSHKRLLQTQIQLAMIHASNDAMHFVQHQLKLFAVYHRHLRQIRLILLKTRMTTFGLRESTSKKVHDPSQEREEARPPFADP